MGRLIDADALIREICRDQCEREAKGCGSRCELVIYVDDTPTVDAVPVVRCKDCRWSKPATNGKGQVGYGCTNNDNPAYEAFWWLTPDWFCADGERRESE